MGESRNRRTTIGAWWFLEMRILIHVEGQTEESFVNSVVAPHLYACGYLNVGARLLGNARARERRGGIKSWEVVRQEIERHLVGDPGCIATTMVDYYALPDSWPGRASSAGVPTSAKGSHVETALAADFGGCSVHGSRFEPFVLMHEFEALLFSDCVAFTAAIGHSDIVPQLKHILAEFPNPEHINDSPLTAPSKRITGLIAGYQKPLFGAVGAIGVGIDKIRAECPHFHKWLSRLELRAAIASGNP